MIRRAPTKIVNLASQVVGQLDLSVHAAGLLPPSAGGIPRGTVLPYAGAAAPSGYVDCDGAAVSRVTYADLFAEVGVAYGAGDGATTFNVPDLRERVPVGVGGSYSRGTVGGAASVTLIGNNLPAHTHAGGGATGAESANHSHTTTTGGISTNHYHSGTTGTESASHSHGITHSVVGCVAGSPLNCMAWGSGQSISTATQSANHTHSFSTGYVSHDHTHTGTSGGVSANHTHSDPATGNNTTTGAAVDVRQPFGVVRYILKT